MFCQETNLKISPTKWRPLCVWLTTVTGFVVLSINPAPHFKIWIQPVCLHYVIDYFTHISQGNKVSCVEYCIFLSAVKYHASLVRMADEEKDTSSSDNKSTSYITLIIKPEMCWSIQRRTNIARSWLVRNLKFRIKSGYIALQLTILLNAQQVTISSIVLCLWETTMDDLYINKLIQ